VLKKHSVNLFTNKLLVRLLLINNLLNDYYGVKINFSIGNVR